MVRMNPLADALNTIEKAGRKGKRQVMVRPCSKVTCKFLMVMMKHGKLILYIYFFRYIFG